MGLSNFTDYTSQKKKAPCRAFFWCVTFFITVVLSLCGVYTYLNNPSQNFPLGEDIIIPEGASHIEIVNILEEKHVVTSGLFLRILLKYHHTHDFVQAGIYNFNEPLTARSVATAITTGDHKKPLVRITFPEGFSVKDFYSFLPSQDKYAKIQLEMHEGYLFPDTYFISDEMNTEDIVALMQENFKEKLQPYEKQIIDKGMSLEFVITLASIIEREAKDTESKHMVSGILQNRLAEDMPLQVDATLDYILNKTSAELTRDDLEIDSAYNSYNNKGLPPTPIANPGLDAIDAVLNPTQSDYLYYLTATDGTFHYAKSFDDHKLNKARYLR